VLTDLTVDKALNAYNLLYFMKESILFLENKCRSINLLKFALKYFFNFLYDGQNHLKAIKKNNLKKKQIPEEKNAI
jgi:hypothetical protein